MQIINNTLFNKLKGVTSIFISDEGWWLEKFYYGKFLAIDFRDDKVIAVCMNKSINTLKLIDYFIYEAPVIHPITKKPVEEVFLERLDKFVTSNKIKGIDTVISLPRNNSIIKTIDMPCPDETKIANMLQYNIDRYILGPSGSVYFDFMIQNKQRGNIYRILLASAKAEVVDYYISLLKMIKIYPTIIDISIFTLCNAYYYSNNKTNKREDLCIIDVSKDNVDIALFGENELYYSKTYPLIDKATESFIKTDYLLNIYHHSINLTKDMGKKIDIRKLLVNGISTDLKERLQQNLPNIDISFLTINKNISYKKGNNNPAFYTATMGTALRCAVRNRWNFNLLPPTLRKIKRGYRLMIAAGLICFIIISGITYGISIMIKDRLTLKQLNKEFAMIKKQVLTVEDMIVESGKLEEHITTFNKIKKEYIKKLDVLTEVSNTLPPHTWITNININERGIEISGSSSIASELIKILEDSRYLKDVRFNGTIKMENGKERFKIDAQLE